MIKNYSTDFSDHAMNFERFINKQTMTVEAARETVEFIQAAQKRVWDLERETTDLVRKLEKLRGAIEGAGI